ncbi:MAG: phosphate ABC transporter substrate-binding protein PstS [Actinobacteria bacterium 21-73-9]|nr:MAG: phosphate ABC transporter substrate-binding protein PstS [Actinobacteria bacterium 21-73-9]
MKTLLRSLTAGALAVGGLLSVATLPASAAPKKIVTCFRLEKNVVHTHRFRGVCAKGWTKKRPTPNPVASVKVENPGQASLTETGSTLLYPLWNIWAPAYQAEFPQVGLTTGGTGSGTGIADAASGTVNIGSSDAYLSSTQLSATPNLLNIPVGISYQMIEYNIPGVTAHLNLNGTVLAGIYTGQITKWNDPAITALNPKVNLPATPIVALHRSDGSGDTFIFTSYLTKTDSSWASKYSYGTTVSWPAISNSLGENGNGGMVSGCQKTVGCIAYVGISYLSSVLGDGQTYAALQNGLGQFVLPTVASAAAEAAGFQAQTPANGTISMIDGKFKGAYPIVNYEYAIVNKQQSSSTVAKAVRSLLEWCIDPSYGQSLQYLGQVNFVTLPTKVIVQSYKQIQSIK